MMGRRRSYAAVIAVLFSLCGPTTPATAYGARMGSEATQHQVQAAMVLNFARFIHWPAGAETTLTICSDERAPVSQALDALSGREVGERVINTRTVDSAVSGAFDPCHLTVLTADVVEAPSSPTVTVDLDNADNPNAAIALVTVGRQTRFVVRPDAARASGVQLSSRLMSLAAKVD